MNTQSTNIHDHIQLIAVESPYALVLDWWRRLDRTIDDYFEHSEGRPRHWKDVECVLRADTQIPATVIRRINRLRRVRNEVAHEARVDLSGDLTSHFGYDAWRLIGELSRCIAG